MNPFLYSTIEEAKEELEKSNNIYKENIYQYEYSKEYEIVILLD